MNTKKLSRGVVAVAFPVALLYSYGVFSGNDVAYKIASALMIPIGIAYVLLAFRSRKEKRGRN